MLNPTEQSGGLRSLLALRFIWNFVVPLLVLAAILWATFDLKLRHLDHSALMMWDESFHAVVAQNVLKHPLKPTLVDVPYLPYKKDRWQETHIWLHKPILPFWQIALSFAALGVNAFALRLPSVILSTGAAWLTYLIGKELFNRWTGLVAAGLQAINPFLIELIHGYQFSDHVDIALLFWVEAGVYFLVLAVRTGYWRYVLLAGLCQGLAFLSKSYLAGIIFGIALSAWLLPIMRLGKREEFRINFTRLLGLLAATVVIVAPWVLYCMATFPDEFRREETQILNHLHADVENRAYPWEAVVFEFLFRIYGVFYVPLLLAAFIWQFRTVSRRQRGLWLTYAWALGVIVPHLLVVTKTDSATTIAVPACLLLVGYLISEAIRGDRWPLAFLSAVLLMGVVVPLIVGEPGSSYLLKGAFGEMRDDASWFVLQLVGSLTLVGLFALGWVLTRRLSTPAWQYLRLTVRILAVLFCLSVLGWRCEQTVVKMWDVTDFNIEDPICVDIGQFARTQLPANAVLFLDERYQNDRLQENEHLSVAFYADRVCYPLVKDDVNDQARQVVSAGGVPYLVSYRNLPLPVVYVGKESGPRVYAWQPAGH